MPAYRKHMHVDEGPTGKDTSGCAPRVLHGNITALSRDRELVPLCATAYSAYAGAD